MAPWLAYRVIALAALCGIAVTLLVIGISDNDALLWAMAGNVAGLLMMLAAYELSRRKT